MKSKELVSLLECDRKYEIGKLSLKTDNMRYQIFSEAIREMTKAIADRQQMAKVKEWIFGFLEESYKSEWFLLSWQKKKAVENDYALLE